MDSVFREGEQAEGFEKELLEASEKADKIFAELAEEAVQEDLAKINAPEPADRLQAARKLGDFMISRIRGVMYDSGKIHRMKIEDPGAIEEFWRLWDRFDEFITLYLEGEIPRDTQWLFEEIAFPGGPKVKVQRIKPGDTLMDAARDLFVYIALL